jgi:hypothetical protein
MILGNELSEVIRDSLRRRIAVIEKLASLGFVAEANAKLKDPPAISGSLYLRGVDATWWGESSGTFSWPNTIKVEGVAVLVQVDIEDWTLRRVSGFSDMLSDWKTLLNMDLH